MQKIYWKKLRAGYCRAMKHYPVESRFFLFLTGMGSLGLMLQKETLVAGIAYAAFWTSFMISMMSFWHDELFARHE